MTEDKLSAAQYKLNGNKLFSEAKYKEAIDEYMMAIEEDSEVAVYYSNAATCYSRLGEHEKTLELINNAISLDPTFIKALYRRGVALMELKRFKEASDDFIKVCQEFPADVEAQKRLRICDKEIDRKMMSFEESMRMGFSAAIRVDKFELNRKCVDGMNVDVSYDGPIVSLEVEENVEGLVEEDSATDKDTITSTNKSTSALTVEWVRDTLIPHFYQDRRLHIKYAYSILLLAKEAFEKEGSLVDIPIEEGQTMTVCGDIHGQFFDLLEIFKKNGYPSTTHKYLFNGDVVDRGAYSVECLLTLCALKVALPQSFFVSRGNHESETVNRVHGFYEECTRKYQCHQFFSMANVMLNTLPIAYVIGEEWFVVHGGLPDKPEFSLKDVREIERFRVPENGTMLSQLLWSDPQEVNGIRPSHRGEGILFGPDVTMAFLERNGLKQMIRSHVWQCEGYAVEQEGQCITIFSAPNYTGTPSFGAWINITHDFQLKFKRFSAAKYQGKHEKPRPSASIRGGWY